MIQTRSSIGSKPQFFEDFFGWPIYALFKNHKIKKYISGQLLVFKNIGLLVHFPSSEKISKIKLRESEGDG